MIAFLAITSVINLALGYVLATYVLTGSFLPSLDFGGAHLRADDEVEGPEARISYRMPNAEPSPPIGVTGNSANSASSSALQNGDASAPLADASPSSSELAAGANSLSASSPPAAPTLDPDPAVSEDVDSSAAGEGEGDGDVEGNVMAGIEAFRAQLAEMKEHAALGSLNDG